MDPREGWGRRGKFCDGFAMDLRRICDGFAMDLRRIFNGFAIPPPTAFRRRLKSLFQLKMDLGVRLGVLVGIARSMARLVPSLDFDDFA